MASIAIAHRPALVTAGLLTVLALVPWQLDSGAAASAGSAAIERGDDAARFLGPLTIDIPNTPSANVPNQFDAWGFADMRPWPHGMVIYPRPTDDYAVLQRTGTVYSLLSGLLAQLFGADA